MTGTVIQTSHTLKNFSDFYDWVIPDIPGYIPGMIDMALRDAAIEFCEKALIWKETLDPIEITSGVDQYDLSLPAKSVLADVLEASLVNGWLDPINTVGVRNSGGQGRGGAPSGYLFYDDTIVTIDPAPTSNDTLNLIVALKPSRASDKLPSFLLERWIDAVAAGAKSRLMRMQKKAWTNPELAGVNESTFRDQVATAGMVAAKNRTRMPMRTRYVHGIE